MVQTQSPIYSQSLESRTAHEHENKCGFKPLSFGIFCYVALF